MGITEEFLLENWLVITLTAIIPFVIPLFRAITGHLSYRYQRQKSEIDVVKTLQDNAASRKTAEGRLLTEVAASYLCRTTVKASEYRVLKNAREPFETIKRYRFVKPIFVLHTDGSVLAYKKVNRLLYSRKRGRVSFLRLSLASIFGYVLFSFTGIGLFLLGLTGIFLKNWVVGFNGAVAGGFLFWIGYLLLVAGMDIVTHHRFLVRSARNIIRA